ncbi:MAG: biosynthetic-type acetolactate synthase large subunit [Treponema sp.]|nr:biosynthetic-type acetolactate synthase large subunit [Treponema sp.]
MKLSGAQIIVKLLEAYGIETVSGIPGGSILPLYDELNKSSIRHVLVRQEQAAGFIAQGMTRSSGKPAVCMATSGPGAMNLLTSIADARADSIPIIAITGQVNTSLIGTDAFQEADTFGLSFPITKYSVMVKSAKELLEVIPFAFEEAVLGRPGPVLIDVPRDVQLEVIEVPEEELRPEIFKERALVQNQVKFHTSYDEMSNKISQIIELLATAKKPVLYCGGGCNSEDANAQISKFLQKYKLPLVTSLMGIGCISKKNPCFIGMVGMHGSYAANLAMHDADLVIAAGVRFDDRATGLVNSFCPEAKIVHIDIDAAEVDKILPAAISIVADVESVFSIISELISEKNIKAPDAFFKKIRKLEDEANLFDLGRPSGEKKANPRQIISSLPTLASAADLTSDKIIVTTDVGQHQMWAAQFYPVEYPRSFLTSGSLGTMGFGLPAAIGAALANPDKRVVCISGDGSIMMNIQELATLAEQNLAVTVIVFENGTLGMVYQQQKYLFEKNYSASVFSKSPDLLTIARGFGIEAIDADSDSDWYKKAFDCNRANKPCFVRITVNPEETVLPFVPGGKANIDSIRN